MADRNIENKVKSDRYDGQYSSENTAKSTKSEINFLIIFVVVIFVVVMMTIYSAYSYSNNKNTPSILSSSTNKADTLIIIIVSSTVILLILFAVYSIIKLFKNRREKKLMKDLNLKEFLDKSVKEIGNSEIEKLKEKYNK